MSWVIVFACYMAAMIAFVLTGMESPVEGFVVALLVSVPLWVLYMVTGRPVRRDEGKK